MREIKFRGKAQMSIAKLDTAGIEHKNGWVIGNLITGNKYPRIVGGVVESNEDYMVHEWWLVVDPDTVGQYTGLKDKNGVEIYEGDIIENTSGYTDIYGNKRPGISKKIYRVGWHEEGKWNSFDGMTDEYKGVVGVFQSQVWSEVIGNIYENPELLEGTK